MDKKRGNYFSELVGFLTHLEARKAVYVGFLAMLYSLKNMVIAVPVCRVLCLIITTFNSGINCSLKKFYYNEG